MKPWAERKLDWTHESLCKGFDETCKRAQRVEITPTQRHVVVEVLEAWFWALEDGTANQRRPNPLGKRYSAERCDALIAIIDERFEYDLLRTPTYWAGLGKDYPPEFCRLEGGAREAFAQDIFGKLEEAIELAP